MPNKNKILITGGAGFVGTNLIKLFLKNTKYNLISLDNYSTGTKFNHIKYLLIFTYTRCNVERRMIILSPNQKTKKN